MDIEKLLKDSWEKYIPEIVSLILFVFVGSILCITIILIPLVIAGMTEGFLRYAREGRKPELSDLWSRWDKFIAFLLLMIVAGALIMIGFMFLVIPGLLLCTLWMYSAFYIIDRDMGFWEAMETSRKTVMEAGLGENFVIFLIMGVLNSLGSALGGIGAILTAPYGLLLMANAYVSVSGETQQEGLTESMKEIPSS